MIDAERDVKIQALKALVDDRSLHPDDYYRKVGKLFGYPDCCIDFFVREWAPARYACAPIYVGTTPDDEETAQLMKSIFDLTEAYAERFMKVTTEEGGYVPCPICLEKLERATG